MSPIACLSTVVNTCAAPHCGVKSSISDDEECTDGEMRRPTIFCRWTLLHAIANDNGGHHTDCRRPTVLDTPLCNGQSFLGTNMPSDLSIRKVCILGSFGHRRMFFIVPTIMVANVLGNAQGPTRFECVRVIL